MLDVFSNSIAAYSSLLTTVLLHSVWQAALVFAIYRMVPKQKARISSLQLYWPALALMSLMILTIAVIPTSTVADLGISSLNVERQFSWKHYFVIFWVLGAVLQWIRLSVDYFKISAWKRKGVLVTDGPLHQALITLTNKIGQVRVPELRLVEDIAVPMVLGVIKPVLLFPICLTNQLNQQEIENILLHELYHIKRHDYLWNLILSCLEVILFFNPFVHLLLRDIRIQREVSCDQVAARITQSPRSLATALLRIEELAANPKLAMALNSQGQLSERIHLLLNLKPKRRKMKLALPAFWMCVLFVPLFFSFKNKSTELDYRSYVYDVKFDSITVPGFSEYIHSVEFQSVDGEIKDVRINNAPVALSDPDQVYALQDQMSHQPTVSTNRKQEFQTGLIKKYHQARKDARKSQSDNANELDEAPSQLESSLDASEEIRYNLAAIDGYKYGKSLDTAQKWFEWTFPESDIQLKSTEGAEATGNFFIVMPESTDDKVTHDLRVKYDASLFKARNPAQGYTAEFIENEIEQMLLDYGIVKNLYSYTLELNNDFLTVNDKVQSHKHHAIFKARYIDMTRKNPSSNFNYQILKNQIR